MRDVFQPTAGSIGFDNSNNGFAASDVQAAIEEARSTSGAQEQFSHSGIDLNLIIPIKRQMLVYQEIEIEAGKTLDILGELVLLD